MLDFSKDYILENEVAKLTSLKESDLESLLPFALAEPTLWEYSLLSAAGKENMEKYMQIALEHRSQEKSYAFLVRDKRTNEIGGSTRFYDYQGTHQTVQLGYTWYGKKFQRTGLNRNCKLLMLDFAFEEMKMQRVEFRADANNARSIAAMKAIGCTAEGILRSNCAAISGRRDSIILSILKDEWYVEKKAALEKKCY